MGSIGDSQEVEIEIDEDIEEEDIDEDVENKKFESRIPGSLAVLNLSEPERECLLDYLNVAFPKAYSDFVFSLLGDKGFLSFFDMLEGLTLKIPSRQFMAKTVNYIKIYMYLKSRGFTEDAYERASKLYKKRVVSLKRIVNKVEEILQKSDKS